MQMGVFFVEKACDYGRCHKKISFFEASEKSGFFREADNIGRNFLRQQPSTFDLRNQAKRKICFLKSSRLLCGGNLSLQLWDRVW